jgi:ligand-binding sensor domain-containing protein
MSLHCQEWVFKELFSSRDFANVEFKSFCYGSWGDIYLGTSAGLFKTDGYNKTQIPLPDSLENETITALIEYAPEVLLLGSGTGKLIKIYMPGGDIEFIASTGAEIKDIWVSDNKNIWMATYGKGLIYFDDSLRTVKKISGLLDDYTYCLEADIRDRIWIGTDRGINILQTDGSLIGSISHDEGLPDVLVTALYQGDDNRMWIGMESGGISYVDLGEGIDKVIIPEPSWETGMVTAILQSSDGVIIATKSSGIFYMKEILASGSHRLHSWSVSPEFEIIGMVEDHHRNIIVLTPRALMLTPGKTIQLWTSMNGFTFHDIHALHIDEKGKVWFSIYNSLYMFDPESGILPAKIFETLPTSSIISLYEDPFGNLWAGTFGEGLYIIDKQGFRKRHLKQSDGLPDENIIALTGDSSQVWLATLGGVANCLLRGNPIGGSLTLNQLDMRHGSGLDINFLYDIYKDSRGTLWFATDGSGIVSYRNGKIQTYLGEKEPGRQVILAITEDRSGNLWFATSNDGLYRLDSAGFKKYRTEEGLRDLTITTMILDHHNNLLILSGTGFDILNTETGSFTYLDPLYTDKENEYFLNAAGLDPGGNIWLGSKNGIVRFALMPDAGCMVPVTILERVKVFYEDFDFRNRTKLDYRENHLIFQFSSVWYRHPEAVTFQYQLEPMDPGWFNTSSREVSYSGLAPGKYTFMVRSAINNQFGQASTSAYSFTIRRPFYLQWWFLVIAVFVFTGVFMIILRIREKNIKKREQKARELVILQFETLKNQVNPHFLFNSLNTLVSMIRQDRDIATEYVENLAEYFRNILAYKNIDLIPLSEEIALMRNYYYLQQKRYGENLMLDLDLDAHTTESLIPPLTLQILMENAIKHNEVSSRKQLKIRILKSDGYILVENNLQLKIHAETSTKTGLDNIKSRYRLASGMEVREENDGSVFRIYLPLIKHHHESTLD